MNVPHGPRRWKVFSRRERWSLTVFGWILLVLACAGLLAAAGLTIHPFLAQNDPVECNILVVEGWLPDFAIRAAVQEFHSRPYRCIITTGGPLGAGEVLSGYKSFAVLCAETLRHLGVDSARVIAVPAPRMRTDRTYASALALKRWIPVSGMNIHALNLFSLGAHTRRSRLLFQRALGDSVVVGSLSAIDYTYDPARWWRYSDGVENVIFESVGYVYVKFLFPFSEEHALDESERSNS